MQDGHRHDGKVSPMVKTSSGVSVEQETGERKPITEVINVYELAGDQVRAALMQSIKAAVLEARKARVAAEQYVQRQRQQAAQQAQG